MIPKRSQRLAVLEVRYRDKPDITRSLVSERARQTPVTRCSVHRQIRPPVNMLANPALCNAIGTHEVRPVRIAHAIRTSQEVMV
jgi:hypothetical protein